MVESPLVMRPGLLTGVARRRWATVLVLSALGAMAGGAAAVALPTTYTASAGLFLEPLEGNPFSPVTATTRNEQIAALQTEVALLSTTEVAEAARERAPALPADAVGRVEASVPSNSQVIEVSYTAASAGLAQQGADAFAASFLAYRQERAERVRAEQAGALEQQLADTAALLSTATESLEAASEGTANEVQLQQQVQQYASQLSQLQVQLLSLDSTAATAGEIISPALLPVGPDGLPQAVLVLAGLGAGLLAGVLLGVYREHRDARMHTVDEVGQLGTGPVLSTLRVERGGHAHAEGYRSLAAAVLTSLPSGAGVITVVGTDESTSSTAAACGLADVMVSSGHVVTLVVVAGPDVADDGPALDEAVVAADSVPLDVTAERLGHDVRPDLRVVTVRASRSLSAGGGGVDDLLQHPRTAMLLHAIADTGRVVLVAAPPMPHGSALSLAGQADQVVLLLRLGQTRFDDAAASVDRLARIGARLLGAAVQVGLPRAGGEEHLRRGPTPARPTPAPEAPPHRGVIGDRASATAPRGSDRLRVVLERPPR